MIIEAIFALALTAPSDPKPPVPKPPTLSREALVAHSSRGLDMRGPAPSAYRGQYYRPSQESFRRCVGQREGMWHYDVRGGGGGNYYGTYQFSRAFQSGIPYMMAKESRRTHDGLTREALALRSKPINHWSRYWQDRAFATVLNYGHDWSGKHHWSGGRWHC